MRIFNTLKRLAARGPSTWPVLSVYVNTRPVGAQMTTYRPFLKKRMAEELKAFKPRSPEHESLAVDFSRVQHYLDYDIKDTTKGAAVFACYADDDVFDAVQVPIEFAENLVTVGPLPTLFPLLKAADRYRRAAVLVANTNTARLFVIGLGAIETRREVRNPVLHKPKNAGEADPANVQRHVENAWQKHARQAIQALDELLRESGASYVLIGGDDPIVPTLLSELSHPARERLLGEHHHWDIRIPEHELAAEVERLIQAQEAVERRTLAERLLDGVGEGGSAIGLEKTLIALRESRVSELVLSEGFPSGGSGWACRSCRTFAPGEPPRACTVCGRETVEAVPLHEEMGAQAQAQGARVRFIQPRAVPEFDARGGVGALLRYR
ncbi:MAG: hypothetical protein ACREOU_08515 [Candidatus Eiseniibacteriota bacterium]